MITVRYSVNTIYYGKTHYFLKWSLPSKPKHPYNTVQGLSRGMNGVTQKELSFLLLLWGLSDPRIAGLREMPRSFSIKLHCETQVSGRPGMSGGGSPWHAHNPLSCERKKTLSITHHALSPPPSHHHLYIISSHQLITTFLSYYNVTWKTFCAEKWRKAMIDYYYYSTLAQLCTNARQMPCVCWVLSFKNNFSSEV